MSPHYGRRHAAGLAAIATIGITAAATTVDAGAASTPARVAPAAADTTTLTAITDDTAQIHVSVPADWTDVDTAPYPTDDGTEVARILAAADLGRFNQLRQAGIDLRRFEPGADTYATATALDYSHRCSTHTTERWGSGELSGYRSTWSDCDTTGAEVHSIAAYGLDRSALLYAAAVVATPQDSEVIEAVIASIGFVDTTRDLTPGDRQQPVPGKHDPPPSKDPPSKDPQGKDPQGNDPQGTVTTAAPTAPTPTADPSAAAPSGDALPAPTLDPTALGDDAHLNALATTCHGGDMAACDQLFRDAPQSSAYSRFAHTCAGRRSAFTLDSCVDAFPAAAVQSQFGRRTAARTSAGDDLPPPTLEPPALGDPELDALAQRCYDGDLAACDELLDHVGFDGPGGEFAASCAGRKAPGNELFHTSCVNAFPNITWQTVPAATSAAAEEPASPVGDGVVIPGTERPEGIVTVTEAGDVSTLVDLAPVYTPGSVATVRSETTMQGREDDYGSVATFNHRFTGESTNEVVAVAADGSCTVLWTRTGGSTQLEYSPPGDEDRWSVASIIDGLPVLIEFGADRQSRLMRIPNEAAATPDQIDFLSGTSSSLGPALPPAPVGVGAVWTWTSSVWITAIGFEVPATAISSLDAVDGDRYTITTELTVDFTDVPAERLPPNVVAVTGTAGYTFTTIGSISAPLDIEQRGEGTVDVTLDFGDGTWTQEYTVSSTMSSTTPADA